MTQKILVTHQLPGERIHHLADCSDMNVWMGPGLLSAEGLAEELAGCQGVLCLLTDRIDGWVVTKYASVDTFSKEKHRLP